MERNGAGARQDEGTSQQETPGDREGTTRRTPATAAGQSSAQGAATMTGSAPSAQPSQEVSATGRNTSGETREGGNQGEDAHARQRSSLSTLTSDAPVGSTRTVPTDPGGRRQGYRLSTEKHPDNPHLFYADGRGRKK